MLVADLSLMIIQNYQKFIITQFLFYRDLSIVKADISRSARAIQSATLSMEKTQRVSVNQNILTEEQGRREKVTKSYSEQL